MIRSPKVSPKKYSFKKVINLTTVILFFSMIFFWYSQVTETAFNAGVAFIETTFKNLHEFFILESRGKGEALLGKDIMQKGIPHKIEFAFAWFTLALISIGVITLIRKYKEMSFPELNFKKPEFLRENFEVAYSVVALVCVVLLVVTIALPYIAVGYGLDRHYPLAITILSVFFVIGGMMVAKYLKVQAYLIILLVLIPYFGIYADFIGNKLLQSQGRVSESQISYYWFSKPIYIDGYIYLRYQNTIKGKLQDYNKTYNMAEYSDIFAKKNRVYDNGLSEVWR